MTTRKAIWVRVVSGPDALQQVDDYLDTLEDWMDFWSRCRIDRIRDDALRLEYRYPKRGRS